MLYPLHPPPSWPCVDVMYAFSLLSLRHSAGTAKEGLMLVLHYVIRHRQILRYTHSPGWISSTTGPAIVRSSWE